MDTLPSNHRPGDHPYCTVSIQPPAADGLAGILGVVGGVAVVAGDGNKKAEGAVILGLIAAVGLTSSAWGFKQVNKCTEAREDLARLDRAKPLRTSETEEEEDEDEDEEDEDAEDAEDAEGEEGEEGEEDVEVPTPTPPGSSAPFYCTTSATTPRTSLCARSKSACSNEQATLLATGEDAGPCVPADAAVCFFASAADSEDLVEQCAATVGGCQRLRGQSSGTVLAECSDSLK